MSIANQGFPAFRADLNDALPALASNNSGATEPSTMFAHQWWVDTSANPSVLKQRNADNDAWITFGTINQTGDTFSLVAESATLSGGTANGVAYLNGSKVLTSGSALTFDGSAVALNTSTTSDALRIAQTGTGNAFVVEDSTSPDSTPFVIDAGGKIIQGYTTLQTGAGGLQTNVQISATTSSSGIQSFVYSATSTASAVTEFLKSASGSVGTNTTVVSGGDLGVVRWSGADGTNFIRSAEIKAQVDGTPGTNDMPGRLVFSTTADGGSSPTERLRIDSAGNVGIGGTNTNNARLALVNNSSNNTFSELHFRQTYAPTVYSSILTNFGGSLVLYADKGNATPGTSNIVFSLSNSERMRINSSGNLLVGTTSSTLGGDAGKIISDAGSGLALLLGRTGDGNLARFYRTGTQVGSINVTAGATAYNTSSDYRLKEDWQPMTGATERVKALKPVNFAWKVDGSRVDGFLAHEAQEVVPECVTGTKDAVDAEGKPNYQGIDQSKLVPLLTAALQEALTKIDSLTARIEALEGN